MAYDLTTKTQDVSSLRVYRGPSMVAFTLMMFAYSLRKWRRNGVACDELIFLPGTIHGRQSGIEGVMIESVPSRDAGDNHNYASVSPVDSMEETQQPIHTESSRTNSPAELGNELANGLSSLHVNTDDQVVEMVSLGSRKRRESEGSDSVLSSRSRGKGNSMKTTSTRDDSIEEGNCSEGDMSSPQRTTESNPDSSFQSDTESCTSDPETTNSNRGIRARLRRWFTQHPYLAQVWTFFFNRSAGPNGANAAYAPSGPAVFGASLDLLMPVLLNFHIFILTFNHIQRPDYEGSDFYAKTLPIAFMSVLYLRVVIPPGRRLRFWNTMKFTFFAPCFEVGVRDEFIGECLTSWVRPLQDLVFATIYFFLVIYGTLSGQYSLMESGDILTESWTVHNIVLPVVAIVPLWMRYLQTLRQAYDANRRWPYLGNAFKYLTAALVIIYGTVHPEERKNRIWMACFAFAVVYQILWDVFVDWQLFEIQQEITVAHANTSTSGESLTTRPSSFILLGLQLHVVQPIKNCCQRLKSLRYVQLREKRLYKTKRFYWLSLAYNILTRFTWMCCFIPAYHRSRRAQVVFTATSDVQSYWGVLLPAAEVVRRTIWGFFYLEKETIKMMETDSKYQQVGEDGEGSGEDTFSDEMSTNSKTFKNQLDLMPTWLGKQQEMQHSAATSRSKRLKKLWRFLFFIELCIWVAAFVVLGGLAAII